MQVALQSRRSVITYREIQVAVTQIFPGELAKHAVAEGKKVIDEYNNTFGARVLMGDGEEEKEGDNDPNQGREEEDKQEGDSPESAGLQVEERTLQRPIGKADARPDIGE